MNHLSINQDAFFGLISRLIREGDDRMYLLIAQYFILFFLYCTGNVRNHKENKTVVYGLPWPLARQTPDDILAMLNRKLKSSFEKKKLHFEAVYVTNIRNWSDSMPRMTTLAGAFRKRSIDDERIVPHSFAYVRRDALPRNLQDDASNNMPRRFAESPSDVFLLMKAYVSDTKLCQAPLLVWPGQEVAAAQEALRKIALNQVPGIAVYLDDDRKTVLLEIASYLEKNYNQYGRGIVYLRQLAGTFAKPRVPAPQLQFLLNGPGIGRHLNQFSVFISFLRDLAMCLVQGFNHDFWCILFKFPGPTSKAEWSCSISNTYASCHAHHAGDFPSALLMICGAQKKLMPYQFRNCSFKLDQLIF